jgi:hypothetical protein
MHCPGTSHHVRAGEEALNRRFVGLGVDPAIVVAFDPRLRRLVEKRQGEIRDVLQHGEEAALYHAPQRLDFTVRCGRVRQCSLMENAKPIETFVNLDRRHGGAVVALSGSWEPTLLEGLR